MEELKNALQVIINITEKTDAALEDGKVNISEGIGIAMSAIGLIKVVKQFPEIQKEFTKLTDAQKADLNKWFAGEFQLNEKKTEKIIEEVFDALLGLNTVIGNLKSAA